MLSGLSRGYAALKLTAPYKLKNSNIIFPSTSDFRGNHLRLQRFLN